MKPAVNRQLTLKPQDLLVLFKVALTSGPPPPYQEFAKLLGMSSSEVHASFRRAQHARLLLMSEQPVSPLARDALVEFVIHGAKYAFPATLGPPTRGIPTAHAAPILRSHFVAGDDLPPVWPSAKGTVRGIGLHPLYPSVLRAIEIDEGLYEVLALFDAVRVGAAREREMAVQLLRQRLA